MVVVVVVVDTTAVDAATGEFCMLGPAVVTSSLSHSFNINGHRALDQLS